jgi:XTP/dITP diphosphohydrolase
VANPNGEIMGVVEGRCHGVLIEEARGDGGFGYDPYFLVPEYHKTFGELSSRVKNALSHRGRALTQLRPILRRLLKAERTSVP